MSQTIFSSINPSTTSGTQLATILNDFKEAMVSGMSGTARPSELEAGGCWVDTSQAGSPNFKWSFKMYDGTTDRTVFQLNLATGGILITGSEDAFQVSHTSADAVGALLKLIKQRVANNGQVVVDDVLGELQFVGRASDSSNPIVARVKAVASDAYTTTASGAYLAFEATPAGTATMAEMMRLVDGKLGIGIISPEAALHVRANTGAKIGRFADDAVGSKLTFRKARISGAGATQSGDNIAEVSFNTTTSASAEATSAKIEVVATEAHTASAQGTKLILKAAAIGTAVLSSLMEIGEEIKSLVLHSLERLKLNAQDVATTATIAQLNADKALVRMTGSTATDIQGIDSAAGKTKVIVIHNASSASVVIKHSNTSAAAADRFDLPNGRDITVKSGSSAEFFYDETAARWKVKSGAGSGGGEVIISGSRSTPTPITAAGGITASTTDLDTQQFIEGDGGHITVTASPAISAGFQVGQKLKLRSRNADRTVTIPETATGVVLNGDWVGGEDNTLLLDWDGTNWVEYGRA